MATVAMSKIAATIKEVARDYARQISGDDNPDPFDVDEIADKIMAGVSPKIL